MSSSPLTVVSTLRLQAAAGGTASQRWLELLAALADHASITAAAKAVGLSYKAAWDAVDAMNNLAGQPLVVRAKGGKGGGGTVLTPEGAALVATYRAVAEENARFVAAVNARLGEASEGLNLLGKLNMVTSARNHFSGKVLAITPGAVNTEVVLGLPGGSQLVAMVTRESVETLGLQVGGEAQALVKASWVIVAAGSGGGGQDSLQLSARNRLPGTVVRLTPGAVNTEVVIGLQGYDQHAQAIAAIITSESARAMGLQEGSAVCAVFKASSVILGVSR